MTLLKAETRTAEETCELRQKAELETKSGAYRTPELRRVGSVELIQGNGGGCNLDLRNDRYTYM